MVKYHPNVSPRSLTSTTDHIRQYPAYGELMNWYLCWRKYPYPTEVIAALMVETRGEAYSHYPCPLDPLHWHIGRGGGEVKEHKHRHQQAKRTFRKAVRDEIWREYEEKQRVAAIHQPQQ